MKPRKCSLSVLAQICNIIPAYLVSKLAKKYEVDKKARTFSPWSHLVAMMHGHLAHSLSLNDIADTLRNHAAKLFQIRHATPPSRNGLSHANKVRNADLAEDLFWSVLAHLKKQYPNFGYEQKYSGVPHRFKRLIVAIDSTVIQLAINCIEWAKHRRRKAAAKCHMQLNLQTFLPQFAIVKPANTHDSTEAIELCANLKDGEIAVFDKAYVDFKHLYHLTCRGVFWVLRAKENIQYRVVGQHMSANGNIIRDVIIELTGVQTREHYPATFRLVEADVLVDKKIKRMTFITNNKSWASSSICDLYKSRWGIEVFFKQIKQTLQLTDFLGYNENAVRWQIWTAMLVYILLRFISYTGEWEKSFRRLFTLVRGVLFSGLELYSVLKSCGTAYDSVKIIATPEYAYMPLFDTG